MRSPTSTMTAAPSRRRVGRPPIPHEHGAWFILYVPLLIPLLAAPAPPLVPALLLILAATGAFLAQHVARQSMRQRRKEGAAFWLTVYLAVAAGALSVLIGVYHLKDLLIVGAAAGVPAAVYAALLLGPRRRLARSLQGELLAVALLTLAAPAAYIVAHGTLDRYAGYAWGACLLYFGSGLFYVNMLLSAARTKGDFDLRARWKAGRAAVLYHAFLFAVLAAAAMSDRDAARLLILAYLPVLIRALWGWTRLSPVLPPLTRVGRKEAGYALWFLGVCVIIWRNM